MRTGEASDHTPINNNQNDSANSSKMGSLSDKGKGVNRANEEGVRVLTESTTVQLEGGAYQTTTKTLSLKGRVAQPSDTGKMSKADISAYRANPDNWELSSKISISLSDPRQSPPLTSKEVTRETVRK